MTEKTADISQRLLWFSREMTSEKRTQCRNSILMTCHYPDLGSASDCFRTCTNVKLHGHPLNTDTSLLWTVCSVPPPRGVLPYISHIGVCSAPNGMVFAPFWSENGLRLCSFWSGIGIVFKETTGVYESIYRFNAK